MYKFAQFICRIQLIEYLMAKAKQKHTNITTGTQVHLKQKKPP